MQIKTTMTCHLTPVRMAVIKKTRNMKYSPRWKEKGTLVYCCWEYKLVQLLRRTVWKFSLQRPRAAAELKADSFQGLDSYFRKKGMPSVAWAQDLASYPLSLSSCLNLQIA